MAAGFAEHVLHQLGRAVGDLGLVGEGGALLTNTPSFTTRSTRSSEPSAALICASSMISGQVARFDRRIALLHACIGADDGAEPGPDHLEAAFDRTPKIAGPDRDAGRVLEPGTQSGTYRSVPRRRSVEPRPRGPAGCQSGAATDPPVPDEPVADERGVVERGDASNHKV